MDTGALEEGYKRLLDVARDGGFSHPAETEAWTAEQVLAHVVVSDRLLAHVTAELLADAQPSYTNEPATRLSLLDEVARAHDDLDGLIAETRRGGLVLVRLTRQLDEARAATAVPTCIVDGATTRVNTPMPWAGVLNTHAEVDLASHAGRLEALRGGATSA